MKVNIYASWSHLLYEAILITGASTMYVWYHLTKIKANRTTHLGFSH
jgi:hypothetical protein